MLLGKILFAMQWLSLIKQMFSIADIAPILLHVQVLKETLVRHGFTFESDTDTEVIPKLAKYVFDKANEGEGMPFFGGV